jgi:hypothetical protein
VQHKGHALGGIWRIEDREKRHAKRVTQERVVLGVDPGLGTHDRIRDVRLQRRLAPCTSPANQPERFSRQRSRRFRRSDHWGAKPRTDLAHTWAGGQRSIEQVFEARPTGFGRARTHPGFKLIPIEETEEWRVADRDSA